MLNTNKRVAIISGGSSDLGVSLEAKLTLEIYGITSETFIDVGVAGLHRFLNQIDEINQYDVLIVCAGMEGALYSCWRVIASTYYRNPSFCWLWRKSKR